MQLVDSRDFKSERVRSNMVDYFKNSMTCDICCSKNTEKILGCLECNKMWCHECTKKISRCPFCRNSNS